MRTEGQFSCGDRRFRGNPRRGRLPLAGLPAPTADELMRRRPRRFIPGIGRRASAAAGPWPAHPPFGAGFHTPARHRGPVTKPIMSRCGSRMIRPPTEHMGTGAATGLCQVLPDPVPRRCMAPDRKLSQPNGGARPQSTRRHPNRTGRKCRRPDQNASPGRASGRCEKITNCNWLSACCSSTRSHEPAPVSGDALSALIALPACRSETG